MDNCGVAECFLEKTSGCYLDRGHWGGSHKWT